MKRIVFIGIIIIFSVYRMQAQLLAFQSFYPNFYDSSFSCLSMQTSFNTQCNSFAGSFINAIKNSSYISNDIKKDNAIKKNNFAGYEWNNDVSYYLQPDSLFGMESAGIHVGVSYQQFFSLSVSDDVYNLVAYGNKNYAGKHLSLKNNEYQYYNYGTFSLGFFKNFTERRLKVSALFDVNFHLFKDVQYLYVNDGDIYTAEDGTSVEMYAKAKYYGTPSSSKLEVPGFSMNALIRITDLPSGCTFSFQVHQLGSLFLNKKSYYAYADTSIYFDGVTVSEILNTPTYQAGILSQDSLTNLYEQHIDTMKTTLMLPEAIRFSVQKKWKHTVFNMTELGTSFIFHTGQTMPVIYVLQTFSIHKNFMVGVGGRYGGFSVFNSYVMAEYAKTRNISIKLTANALLSILYKKYPYNFNIQAGIVKYW